MTSTPDETMSRDERRLRTADLLARAAETTGAEREALIHQVVELNLRVAHAVARRFRGRGIALEDLEQVAAMALVRAAAKFDLGQERDFLTYAVPTMSGELKRHFRDLGWTIRPPRRIQEIQSKVMALQESGHEDGSPMRPDEIAAVLDVPVGDVEEAINARGLFHPTSLDQTVNAPSGEGRASLADLLIDDDREQARTEARVVLEPVLRRLSERDRRILQLRFAEDQTQAEIGAELGVTQMQVSRLLSRILGSMREELAESRETAATP
jgi:RNA polymerase sigma-B factor